MNYWIAGSPLMSLLFGRLMMLHISRRRTGLFALTNLHNRRLKLSLHIWQEQHQLMVDYQLLSNE